MPPHRPVTDARRHALKSFRRRRTHLAPLGATAPPRGATEVLRGCCSRGAELEIFARVPAPSTRIRPADELLEWAGHQTSRKSSRSFWADQLRLSKAAHERLQIEVIDREHSPRVASLQVVNTVRQANALSSAALEGAEGSVERAMPIRAATHELRTRLRSSSQQLQTSNASLSERALARAIFRALAAPRVRSMRGPLGSIRAQQPLT